MVHNLAVYPGWEDYTLLYPGWEDYTLLYPGWETYPRGIPGMGDIPERYTRMWEIIPWFIPECGRLYPFYTREWENNPGLYPGMGEYPWLYPRWCICGYPSCTLGGVYVGIPPVHICLPGGYIRVYIASCTVLCVYSAHLVVPKVSRCAHRC